eukprot:CAMPEP_0119379230 /NCGR_PEP_ID=MMETSP1334-20130426/51790_1 /TAXON_ID=127549 /ORGANISM="Calcidiscus leptoporus, Strain RCC1130" /LENGTH=419 /DNA_ID=CAMNT_0007398681 /DNA_START=183 /DNA_END=1442 /DNA_ORIENTATION=+
MRCQKLLECGHRCPGLCGEECPRRAFCIQCGSKGQEMVDLIEMKTLSEWDADKEPVIVLRCGHVFAPSTLDKHVGLHLFYMTSLASEAEHDPNGTQVEDEGMLTCVALKPRVHLTEGTVKAPASCPTCKVVIMGVKRYGRPQNYAMLRVLEQKQMIETDSKLALIMSVEAPDLARQQKELTQVLQDLLRHSPTKRVFEAAFGSEQCLVPTPNKTPLLRTLVCLCKVVAARLAAFNYEEKAKAARFFEKNRPVFDDALTVAAETNASLRATTVRLLLASALASVWTKSVGSSRESALYHEGRDMLDAVLKSTELSDADRAKATEVEKIFEAQLTQEELRQVVQAMGGGAHTASDASLHWYECPDGHPYFIGECGGAMEQSKCPECGKTVGGQNHALHSGNARADAFMHRVGLPGSAAHFE